MTSYHRSSDEMPTGEDSGGGGGTATGRATPARLTIPVGGMRDWKPFFSCWCCKPPDVDLWTCCCGPGRSQSAKLASPTTWSPATRPGLTSGTIFGAHAVLQTGHLRRWISLPPSISCNPPSSPGSCKRTAIFALSMSQGIKGRRIRHARR